MLESGVNKVFQKESTARSEDRPSSNISKVNRKFINSAIYVEKPLSTNVSTENCSFRSSHLSEEALEVKTKRCTCSVDQSTCSCHSTKYFNFMSQEESVVVSAAPQKIVKIKKKISPQVPNSSNVSKNEVRKRSARKDNAKKKQESEAKIILEGKLKEKEVLLEQERNNFKKWLINKKKLENEAKKKKEKELQEKQLKELEKEKRQLENKLNFQLWLKKKEQSELERKIKEKVEVIDDLERKESQSKDNEKAFQEWLKKSKNRQRPVPLNKGLETLYSSTSIAYINPNPWNPMA